MPNETLEGLRAQVARDKTVNESAITLIRGFKERLDAAIGDDNALRELSAELGSNSDALAAAVAENTPAQPA